MYRPNKTDFIDSIFHSVHQVHRQDINLNVIVNLAGIGYGFDTDNTFYQLKSWMLNNFSTNENYIDRVYFPIFYSNGCAEQYLWGNFSLKPNHRMIFQPKKDLPINLGESELIGQNESGTRVGILAGLASSILFASEPPICLGEVRYTLITTLQNLKKNLQIKPRFWSEQ
jgi:histidinol phosphatase-like enzyme